jgi:molybdopterin synthase sulfur carrier subunit
LARRVEVYATCGGAARHRLDEKWPGLRDRLCESRRALRPHIHVYVDRERGTLETPLEARSRVDVIAAISGG